MGACPGDDESAGVNYSHRSPKGNRQMRDVEHERRRISLSQFLREAKRLARSETQSAGLVTPFA